MMIRRLQTMTPYRRMTVRRLQILCVKCDKTDDMLYA